MRAALFPSSLAYDDAHCRALRFLGRVFVASAFPIIV